MKQIYKLIKYENNNRYGNKIKLHKYSILKETSKQYVISNYSLHKKRVLKSDLNIVKNNSIYFTEINDKEKMFINLKNIIIKDCGDKIEILEENIIDLSNCSIKDI